MLEFLRPHQMPSSFLYVQSRNGNLVHPDCQGTPVGSVKRVKRTRAFDRLRRGRFEFDPGNLPGTVTILIWKSNAGNWTKTNGAGNRDNTY